MKKFTTLSHLLMLLMLWIQAASGEVIQGKCIAVADGDTATVQTSGGKRIIIRFQGIDAPENGQAYGQEAREKLTSLILGKRVNIKTQGTDHYKRTLGQVYLGKRRINEELVAAGCAWHSDYYAPNDSELAAAQKKAKAHNKGLWQEAEPRPPWQWRKAKRHASQRKPARRFTPADGEYWVSRSGKIHNKRCDAYGISQSGTYTNTPQGINCKACGGTNH